MSEKRRPVIGIMTGQFSEDNTIKLISMITEALSGDNVDLQYYFGTISGTVTERFNMEDIGYRCHHYSLYTYSNYLAPDALIVIFGSVNVGQMNPMDIRSFAKNLPKVPMVLLKEIAPLEGETGSSNVNIDNYKGMKDCVLHLIKEHGCRIIGYLSGPLGHSDSKVRLSAYKDALSENGIPFDESLIIYGDYQRHVEGIVEKLFDAHPEMDAIVSANDEMATAVYSVAKKRGLKPGKDIAVTGFDDIYIAAFMDPPLTTVLQDYRSMAEAASEKVRAILRGERPSSETIPSRLIVRASCGCRGEVKKRTEHAEAAVGRGALINSWQSVNQLLTRSMVTTLFFRNLNMNDASKKEFFESLARQMNHMKARSSFVCLLKEPIVMEDGEMLKAPETLRLYMSQDLDNYHAYDDEDAEEIPYGGMQKLIRPSDEPIRMTNFILFYGRIQYGFLCAEIDSRDAQFFETLSLEIGSALYLLGVSIREQELRRDLEMKNQILDYAASHDHLTGILNRTGIMKEIAETMKNAGGKNSGLLLVMADLDHLKQINDTFGHQEGDSAICTAVDILKRSLPEGSALGRTGGDEFTAVMKYDSDKDIEDLKAAIEKGCSDYNESSGKSYYVNISVGVCPFEGGNTLISVIQKADECLYESKKLRRDSVLK